MCKCVIFSLPPAAIAEISLSKTLEAAQEHAGSAKRPRNL